MRRQGVERALGGVRLQARGECQNTPTSREVFSWLARQLNLDTRELSS